MPVYNCHTTSEEGLGLKIASPNVADPPLRPRSISSDMPAGMISRGTDRDLLLDRLETVLRGGGWWGEGVVIVSHTVPFWDTWTIHRPQQVVTFLQPSEYERSVAGMQLPESVGSEGFDELVSLDAVEVIVSLRGGVVVVDAPHVVHRHDRGQEFYVVCS